MKTHETLAQENHKNQNIRQNQETQNRSKSNQKRFSVEISLV